MADLQDNEPTIEGSAAPQPLDKPEKGKGGKKKKKRGCGFFLILSLLVAGLAAGLQASGGADLRPFVYLAVPRIPLIGARAASILGIPEIYAFTAEERRRIELDEWEVSIAERVRSLDARAESINRVSQDLSERESELDMARDELTQRLEALSGDLAANGAGSAAQREELDRIVRTFQEMSPKNASAILEQLNENLAVAVLDQLPEDVRARVLGRMTPEVAAALTERLSEYQRNR